MTVNPVSLLGHSGLVAPTAEPSARTASAGATSFASVVDRFLGGAAQSHQEAESAVRDLALGRNDNIHQVLMQVAQADLSFRLILEIRNRLSDAYQDIMKMQV